MSKCEFFKSENQYLGHLVKQKVKGTTDIATAMNISEVRHIIGLVGYYRKFFPIISGIIGSLNELTRKNFPFKWTEEQQKS